MTVSDIEKDYLEFDNWVKSGKKFFPEEVDSHHFLYNLDTLKSPRGRIVSLIFPNIIKMQKNIERIYPYTIDGFAELIEELERNLIMGSHWSTFYCIHCLAEKIIDTIIKREEKLISSKHSFIKSKLESGYFSIDEKIKILEEINKTYKTPDLESFVQICIILQRIRNRFMFHLNNYDYYNFVFSKDMGAKEDLFARKLVSIKKEIDKAISLWSATSIEKSVLDHYSGLLDKISNLLSKNRSGNGTYVSNDVFYRDLPEVFEHISFSLVLFLGRTNLNLLT